MGHILTCTSILSKQIRITLLIHLTFESSYLLLTRVNYINQSFTSARNLVIRLKTEIRQR